jgi:DNA-binding HxlR family transcriptional regulator
MKLEKDPAAYLIRSEPARRVLLALREGGPRRPSEVRRSLPGMHPQILKETVDHLATLGLARLRVPPGSRSETTRRGVTLPVILEITHRGHAVLDHLDHYRALVRRDRALLPPATVERWLEA